MKLYFISVIALILGMAVLQFDLVSYAVILCAVGLFSIVAQGVSEVRESNNKH